MERRELYEPEDIEQLLIERPYDELLEEERAFVLRHLSGRDEYEAMRALLLRVHDDDETTGPIDAEPSVRAHVMDVFRAEQRPQWRIWLNSVHAFLLPKQASAMWRPALALGSVALVVFFIANRTMAPSDAEQLAELKVVKEEKEVKSEPVPFQPAEPPASTDQAAAAQEINANGNAHSEATAVEAADEAPGFVHDLEPAPATKVVEEQPAPELAAQQEKFLELAKTEDGDAVTSEGENATFAAPVSGAIALDSTTLVTGTTTHVVTSNELHYNFSAADVQQAQTLETISATSGRLFTDREKSKKSETRKRSVAFADGTDDATADAGAYIDLLRAAW